MPGKKILIISFLVLSLTATSNTQEKSNWAYFRDLSRPVKWWVITHPFSARKALEISLHARKVSVKMEESPLLDGDARGGQVDAFRHGYWMALMSAELSPRKAWRLGYDHEKGNKIDYLKNRSRTPSWLPTAADCTMDIFNNEAGIELGRAYSDLPREDLKEIVLNKLIEGYFIVIKKDPEGNWLDCDGNPIPKDRYFHHWEMPVCLVPSSYNSRKQNPVNP